jgi:malate dehydrogenase (oxaloacetate-decarboxylating)(NADP+)
VTLDVGTNNESNLADPLYIGTREKRSRELGPGTAYDELVREFIEAACAKWPGLLLQFEDFGNKNAFRLLHDYQDKCLCFNDDIQGTACVVLGGLYSALGQLKKENLSDLTFLFQGAGEAGVGIAQLISEAVAADSGGAISVEQARQKVFLFDSKGLVVEGRPDGFRGRSGTLQSHKLPFAHPHAEEKTFIDAVKDVKPDVIVGVSAQPGVFDEEVCRAMAEINETPLIFPLSNPTHKAECTAEQAYTWTEGRCIFASGSPFDPVEVGGKRFEPGQGNNAYIFPGIGLGLLCAGATTCPSEVFIIAAKTLASTVTPEDIAVGRMYPPLSKARDVSAQIAAAVAAFAFDKGIVKPGSERPADLLAFCKSKMYAPFDGAL